MRILNPQEGASHLEFSRHMHMNPRIDNLRMDYPSAAPRWVAAWLVTAIVVTGSVPTATGCARQSVQCRANGCCCGNSPAADLSGDHAGACCRRPDKELSCRCSAHRPLPADLKVSDDEVRIGLCWRCEGERTTSFHDRDEIRWDHSSAVSLLNAPCSLLAQLCRWQI
jgi:hypothetical protein